MATVEGDTRARLTFSEIIPAVLLGLFLLWAAGNAAAIYWRFFTGTLPAWGVYDLNKEEKKERSIKLEINM